MKSKSHFFSTATGFLFGLALSLQPGFAMQRAAEHEAGEKSVGIKVNEVIRIQGYAEYVVSEQDVRPSSKSQDLNFSICLDSWDQAYAETNEIQMGERQIQVVRQQIHGAKTIVHLETGEDIELNRAIGSISLAYLPDNEKGAYYTGCGLIPILRLMNIKIESGFQQKGHGTHALEEVFAKLKRLSPDIFSPATIVVTEAEWGKPYLVKWYKSFGFSKIEAPTGMIRMQVPLSKVKFPKHSQRKKPSATTATEQ